jgi:hypothetical protein
LLARHAKTAALVVAAVVLVVEGFFVYRWYDRYLWAGPTGATDGGPALEGTVPDRTAAEDATAGEGGAFVHRATEGNSRGDYTYLDDLRINGDPDAVVLASPTSPYDRNIGVWYEPGRQRWAIFNQDLAPVSAGAAFDVSVPGDPDRFVHEATGENVVGNTTYVDDPLLNGEPGTEVSVTQNWNPGGGAGVYNDHPVGALYDGDVDRWFVYNEDGAPVPEGTAFNVAVAG